MEGENRGLEEFGTRITCKGRVPSQKKPGQFVTTLYDVDDCTMVRVDNTAVPDFWLELDLTEFSNFCCGRMAGTLSRSLERQQELLRENEGLKDKIVKLEIDALTKSDHFQPFCLVCGGMVANQTEMGMCHGCMGAMETCVAEKPLIPRQDTEFQTPPHSPYRYKRTPDAPKRNRDDDSSMKECKRLRTILRRLRNKYECTKSQLENSSIKLRTMEIERVAEDPDIPEEKKKELVDKIWAYYEPTYESEDECAGFDHE